MSDEPDTKPEQADEEDVPLWAYVVVFVTPAVLLGAVALAAQLYANLGFDRLGIALTIAHVITAAVLFGAYFVLRKKRQPPA